MCLRHAVLAVLLLWACAAAAAPRPERFTGLIASVGEDSVQIATRRGTSRSVRTDGRTKYIKWITHQPWQQSTDADRTFLQVDRCVQVQLQADDQKVAEIIRVNTDQPGSMGDPCRRMRTPRRAR